jgi:hypothetical protein
MKATRYMRKPFFVEGYQVDEDNMQLVAEWCQGVVIPGPPKDFVRVPVVGAKSARQSEARIGMWVLKSMQGGRNTFKIYSDEHLHATFVEVPGDEDKPDRDEGTRRSSDNVVRPFRVPAPSTEVMFNEPNTNARVI